VKKVNTVLLLETDVFVERFQKTNKVRMSKKKQKKIAINTHMKEDTRMNTQQKR